MTDKLGKWRAFRIRTSQGQATFNDREQIRRAVEQEAAELARECQARKRERTRE